MRILVLIVIGLLLYIIIGNILRKKNIADPQKDLGSMARCLYCNLHILEREAIKLDGNYFCSQEHVDAEYKK